MILVDTCVLLDVGVDEDKVWAAWSQEQLAAWSLRGPLLLNPIVFAEWCFKFVDYGAAVSALQPFGMQWAEIPQPALYLAAQAHRRYRARGGPRQMVLPDFFVGAHAQVAGIPLMTRDKRRFDTYFSGLELVAPA